MQRETSSTQTAKRLGVDTRTLQLWVKNKGAPHGRNAKGTRYLFDVGELRAWAVQKGLLSSSDQKAKDSSDSKPKPAKSKKRPGKAKPVPPEPEPKADEPDAHTPEGRRRLAEQILAKIPTLLKELKASEGSTHASQIATAIKSAEATATAMLRRLDHEAERDADLIDRNKAIRMVVDIGQVASSSSKAAVVDVPDRLFDALVAAGVKPGKRDEFIRVCRATVREAEDRRMLELAGAVDRAEGRLGGKRA